MLEPHACPSALPSATAPHLAQRNAEAMLADTRARWGGQGDLWVFGYASLIWRPEFATEECRDARVHGWHRSLQMRSSVNRGTPECPGLVFALVPGGSCRGRAYRVCASRVDEELPRLWAREMPNAVYDPKWLLCQTNEGPVSALAFTLSRRSPNFTGPLAEEDLVHVLRHARGRYGSTLSYLLDTASSLKSCGIRDREIERLVRLVERHELVA